MALTKAAPKSTEAQKADETLEAEAKAQALAEAEAKALAEAEAEAKAQAKAKAAATKTVKKGQMVTCELLKGTWLRQPSTKIAITKGTNTQLKADGWLKLQVDADLIRVVE